MPHVDNGPHGSVAQISRPSAQPLIIATILREEGTTGVQTHVRQLRKYLERSGTPTTLVTPFSWHRRIAAPVFGVRLALEPCSGAAGVVWYRHWHEVFLYHALRRALKEIDHCVIYAQCPVAARAAMRARKGPGQRVVMAVHLRVSQADEWADKKLIKRDRTVFRSIRGLERDVIPRADGLVFVSNWARDALISWLPEAAAVPWAVIDNFVAPHHVEPDPHQLGDLSYNWQPRAREKPSLPVRGPGGGEVQRSRPHPGPVWKGTAPERSCPSDRGTRAREPSPLPGLSPGHPGLSASLPCLRPRFLFGVVFARYYRGDGCGPSHSGS